MRHTLWGLWTWSIITVLSAPAAFSQPDLGGREICMTDGRGQFVCINVDDLRRQVPEAKMQKLLQSLEELLARLGLDPSTGMLTGCGGGRSKVPDLRMTDDLEPSDKRKPKDPAEAEALLNSIQRCARQRLDRIAAGRGMRLTDPGQSNWVTQAVTKVDQDVAKCRDSGNPMIAQGKDEVADRPAKPPTLADRFKVQGVLQNPKPPAPAAPPSGSTPSPETSALFVSPSEGKANKDAEEAAEIDRLVEQYKSIDKKDAGALWAFEKYVGPEKWEKVKKKAGETQSPGQAQQPCREGAECKPSCSDIQAAWKMFKEYCEQSNWQVARCTEFLRKANGCVSATLILPNPEGGDVACPAWAQDDAAKRRAAWKTACERKKMIMIPVDSSRAVCVERDLVNRTDKVTIDPCNDPRAMPSPDACPASKPSRDPGRLPPRPPGPPQ